MTYDFLNLPNRSKPREFKEFSREDYSHTRFNHNGVSQWCLTELKCQADSVVS